MNDNIKTACIGNGKTDSINKLLKSVSFHLACIYHTNTIPNINKPSGPLPLNLIVVALKLHLLAASQ